MRFIMADASTVRGWQRPNRCDNLGPNCVEVAPYDSGVAVRSSQAPNGTTLLFDADRGLRSSARRRRGSATT